MNVREAIVAALRRDPDFLSKLTGSLRKRIDHENGKMATVIQAAEALTPVIEDAVEKRPSRLGKIGLRTSHLLASLAAEDSASNDRLAEIAKGSTVGIVFIDVNDFTAFTAERGDEAAIRAISKIQEVIERRIRLSKGEIVKSLGDGFLLAFPSASQAIRGAIAVARGMHAARRTNDFDLGVCIGVHAGEPLIEGDDLLGHDVNLTARLLDHVRPGGVLVSEAAKELAENRLKSVEFGRRRQLKIRGLAGRVPVYPIRGLLDDRA